MKTTLQLDDHLLTEAKQYATRAGKTLTALISDALRLVLSDRPTRKRKEGVRLVTFRGQGLMPGVDLDCTASLLDLLSESK